MDATVGSEGDLETRIDELPLDPGFAGDLPDGLRRLLEAQKLEGLMSLASTRVLADGTFVGIDSAVVLLASSDWNSAAVRAATSTLTGGLAQAHVATSGKILVAGTRQELLAAILLRVSMPPTGPGASYVARFRPAAELLRFIRMTRLIDSPLKADGPAFFSGNIASLGRALGGLNSASIIVHDTGAVVTQELSYRWTPQ